MVIFPAVPTRSSHSCKNCQRVRRSGSKPVRDLRRILSPTSSQLSSSRRTKASPNTCLLVQRYESQCEEQYSRKEKEMTAKKVMTKHPLGKSGRNIDKNKYDVLKRTILSALRPNDLTHTELFNRLDKSLKGKFAGNIS